MLDVFPLRYTDPTGHFCYDAEENEFTDGDCFNAEQQTLLDYFVQLVSGGSYSDLEIAERMLQASFRLISDPVAALRAVAEIVREEADAPGNWGWEYGRSDFFYEDELDRLGIDWDYDDSGFGDLAEPNPADANQISHFIGIAYISAFEYRESPFGHGARGQALVRGNELLNDQSAKRTDIEVDLGFIAWDMGKALVVNPVPGTYQYTDRTEITTAVQAIRDYDYASRHPFQNWWDSR